MDIGSLGVSSPLCILELSRLTRVGYRKETIFPERVNLHTCYNVTTSDRISWQAH